MKTGKLFGILALIAVITFAFIGCKEDEGDDDISGEGGQTVAEPFTSIAAFKAWLDKQPYNTVATAYNAKINISDLGGDYNNSRSLGYAVHSNFKYVSLDLSGSTFTSIGDDAFYGCSTFTSITIPNSVKSIGEMAFSYCDSLISIIIPNSVTSIGDGAFYKCTSLTSIIIPNSVINIDRNAFNNCTNLTSITLPHLLTSISANIFFCCDSLTSITIPTSVTSIDYDAFNGCYNLTTINVDTGNTAYISQDGILYNKNQITLVQYPAGKTNTSFSIPTSVTRIGEGSFRDCSLTSITIPASVTSIGDSVFNCCTSLTSVTFATGSNITSANFSSYVFPEGIYGGSGTSLRTAYLVASTKAGTYTRPANGTTWSKTS